MSIRIRACARVALALLITIVIGGSPKLASGQCDPDIVGSVGTAGLALDVTISGTLAYVAETLGLQVIDVSNPEAPVTLGGVGTPDDAFGVAVSGTVAYVAAQNSGLQIINVSNPAVPVILGSVATGGFAQGVAISGTVVYVADFNSGLQVIDVSNPAAPVILGSVATPGNAQGVVISGTVAYVADFNSGLQVIDVSNPAAPVILGSVATPGLAHNVAISGTLAYVADGDSGLQVIDVSNPAAPVILGSVATTGVAWDVAISGIAAYVADGASGLQVIDVSDPALPVILGSLVTPGQAFGVAISGAVAYVADGSSGLQVIDRDIVCLLGACCVDAMCLELMSQSNCLALGGTFFGVSSTCATSDCTNDWCYAATPIALGNTPFNTIGATTDGPINPGCDQGDGTRFVNDIWFEYTAPSSGTLTVLTCGQATFDTIIAAYTGSCGSLNLVNCDDEGCGFQTSIMNFDVTAGETYLLRVGGWFGSGFGWSGTGTLSLSLATCPADLAGPGDGSPDGTVGVNDLLALLAAWGACP